MAASVVQTKAATSTTSVTFTSSTSTGNSIVVLVWYYGVTDIGTSAVTDSKSNTYVRRAVYGNGGATCKVAVFDCAAPTMGASHQVSVASGTDQGLCAIEVSGLAATPFDVSGGANYSPGQATTSPVTSSTGALAQADEIVFAAIATDQGNTDTITPTAGEGWSAIAESEAGNTEFAYNTVYKVVSATTALTASWALQSAHVCAAIVATFKATSGVTGTAAATETADTSTASGSVITNVTGTVAVTEADDTSSVSASTPLNPYVLTSGGAAVADASPSVTFSGYTPALNDVVVFFVSSTTVLGAVANASLPAGWVNPLGDGVEINSDAHGMAAFYHLVTQTEVNNVTTTYTATSALDATETGYVQAAVIRDVDTTTPIDSANTAQDSANTVTPHVLAGLTGTNLSTGSLVVSSVAKDGTGAYSSVPGGWSQLRADNTNQGRWLGYRTARTTASTDVTATNITPSAGDEYASITIAFSLPAGVTGSATATETADTSSATGTETITGTSTAAETADTSTATGWHTVTGTSGATEADDTSTASGTLTITGTVAVTEADDTSTASGTSNNDTTGTVAVTEADDTSTASGTLTITGTVAATETADTSTATGTETITGTSTADETADTSTATGITFVGVSGTVAVTEAADTPAAYGVAGSFAHSISGRRILDHAGKAWPMKCSSSWGLAQNLTNAEITTYLEGIQAQGFNAFVFLPCGMSQGGTWVRYQNIGGASYFTGTAWASSLGTAWSTVDHIVSEAGRLGLTAIFSYYTGSGTQGISADLQSAGDTNCYNAGVAIGGRYKNFDWLAWHVGADSEYYWGSGPSTMIDNLFDGMQDAGLTVRVVTAEPDQNVNAIDEFFGGGSDYPNVDFDTTTKGLYPVYDYTSSIPDFYDAEPNVTGATTFGWWDCEPPYRWAGHYGSTTTVEPQKLRERLYAVFFRGGSGINYGNEDVWRFGKVGLFDGGTEWDTAIVDDDYDWCRHAWALIDAYNWASTTPDSADLLTSGEQTGTTRASSCYSADIGLIYLPTSRAITLDLSVFSGAHATALVRKYDPVDGSYTTIGTYATTAGRSISAPGTNSSGTFSDWVITIDGTNDITGTAAAGETPDTSSATGTVTVNVSGTASPTETDDTSTASGAETISGTSTATETADTATATGTETINGTSTAAETADTSTATGALTISGSSAATETVDTSTATGTLTISGTVAGTETADISSAAGTSTDPGTGSGAAVEANDTSTAVGTLTISGTSTAAETVDSSAASGTVTAPNTGTVSVIEDDDTSTATGTLTISGTSTAAETADNSAASGISALPVFGTVAIVEDDDTSTNTVPPSNTLQLVGSHTPVLDLNASHTPIIELPAN